MVLIWRTCSTIKGFLIWFIPVTLMFDHVIRCWSPLGVKGLTFSFKGEVFTFNNQLFRSGNKVKAITSGVPYNFSLLMQCEMQWKEQNSIFLFYKNWILFLLNHDERLLHEISDLHWIYYRLIAELTKDHWKHQKNARHHQKQVKSHVCFRHVFDISGEKMICHTFYVWNPERGNYSLPRLREPFLFFVCLVHLENCLLGLI